jgi:hypothetical protein
MFGDRLLASGPPFVFPEGNLYVSGPSHLNQLQIHCARQIYPPAERLKLLWNREEYRHKQD